MVLNVYIRAKNLYSMYLNLLMSSYDSKDEIVYIAYS